MRGSIFTGLAALLIPSAALAQSANTAVRQIEISGEASGGCLVSAAPGASGANAALDTSNPNSAVVRIADLVNPATGQVQLATISLALPVVCNASHQVVVRSVKGGLGREGAPSPAPGFRELAPYTITAAWAGATVSAPSQVNQPLTLTEGDGAAGNLSISLSLPAGGAPLVAGAYSDELIIELQVAS
jgi:hypothetical protein